MRHDTGRRIRRVLVATAACLGCTAGAAAATPTWTLERSSHQLDLIGQSATRLTVDPATGAVYLSTGYGLLRLAPDNRTWRPLSPIGGSEATNVVATGGAILVTEPDGHTLRSGGAGRPFVATAATPIVALAATATILGLDRGGNLVVSRDAGLTWNPYPGVADIVGVIVQPTRTSGVELYRADVSGGLERSYDLGASWLEWLTGTQLGAARLAAALGPVQYLIGQLHPADADLADTGLAVAVDGGPPRQIGRFGDLTVTQVLTTFAHPQFAVAIVGDSSTLPDAWFTRDAGATWTRLALPAGGECALGPAALTPDARLVAVYRSRPGLPRCRVATSVSRPLAR
jgi:hypothetical protein